MNGCYIVIANCIICTLADCHPPIGKKGFSKSMRTLHKSLILLKFDWPSKRIRREFTQT